MALDRYPFDPEKLLGAVSEVGPNYVRAAFIVPFANGQRFLHGHTISSGQVGDFVLIECHDRAIFGRILKVRLPEKERHLVEPKLESPDVSKPIAEIQILSSIALLDGTVTPGIQKYPDIGARVYLAPGGLLKGIASSDAQKAVKIALAHLPGSPEQIIEIAPEKLFGRHCAVLGATGGGKSWTLARLVEETKKSNSKAILLDPTGEFWRLESKTKHVHICPDASAKASTEVSVHYRYLTESDLMAMFSPSGQTQVPKLRAAMKSLKLAKSEPQQYLSGHIPKANQPKATYNSLYKKNAKSIEGPSADFEIKNLVAQIQEECVWPSAQNNANSWGGPDNNALGYVTQMIARIESMVSASELACIFDPGVKPSVFNVIDDFLASESETCLRISLRTLSFEHHVREIICNCIGRYLLKKARDGSYKRRPLVIFLDEAHQFLNKHLGDENSKFPLDAFDLIAKEGRKYGLTICMATQRPREIPEGVLSQMGTLIVHRLINDKDREVVERASGEIDKSASEFLPILGQGQAVVVGVDFPAPITVQMCKPLREPDSRGPDYQKHWGPSWEDIFS